ncbi:MAG: 16S rRNA (cytosine(967)-C(5))-methyltransferase RsmB [Deltaproteobacteria bacterium]
MSKRYEREDTRPATRLAPRAAPRQRPATAEPPNLRELALEITERVSDGAFCDALVGDTLDRHSLEPRDAALLTRLAYGVQAWRGRLDWTLAPLCKRPLEELDSALREALRLGLLQLLFLDRVPAHAAVSTTVEVIKRRCGRGAGGLINAILRRILREGERALPDAEKDPIAHLAIRFSHPEWIVRRWRDELGEEATLALLAANQEAAATTLRIGGDTPREAVLEQLASEGIAARAGRFAPRALILEGPLAALKGRAHSLDLVAQGEASQLVASLVAAKPGERIADLCAAPGGKTLILAEAVGDSGVIFATDRVRGGIRRVSNRGIRCTARADAAYPPLRDADFDAVLVDAPCSGLGTLRGHPEIRWRRTPEDVAALAATQARILEGSAPLVKPGGRLIYATCTLLAEENEAVIRAFRDRHPEFAPLDAAKLLPPEAAPLADEQGCLRTSPGRDQLDGFFATALIRRLH